MNRIGNIAGKIATETPLWASTDFIHQIGTSNFKKYNGTFGAYRIWVLKYDSKIYKDRFGWISVNWEVNPVLDGLVWKAESSMSFAPATSGSFAREKFEEFKNLVDVSGDKDFALFGIHSRKLSIQPREGMEAINIGEMIKTHLFDLKEAKKFWKVVSNEAKSKGLI